MSEQHRVCGTRDTRGDGADGPSALTTRSDPTGLDQRGHWPGLPLWPLD